MPKAKKEVVSTNESSEEVVETKTAKADPRLPLWKEYIENYKTKNPVKYALKVKNGDFDTIPASFLGKEESVKGKRIIR